MPRLAEEEKEPRKSKKTDPKKIKQLRFDWSAIQDEFDIGHHFVDDFLAYEEKKKLFQTVVTNETKEVKEPSARKPEVVKKVNTARKSPEQQSQLTMREHQYPA